MSVDKCIEHAMKHLSPMQFRDATGNIVGANASVCEQDCEIYVWPQAWSDTSCGFGGCAGQMITGALTVVVIGPELDACVYHAGRLAYKIDQVNDQFRSAIDVRHMPGVRQRSEIRKLGAKIQFKS